jgi:hypothetical protein
MMHVKGRANKSQAPVLYCRNSTLKKLRLKLIKSIQCDLTGLFSALFFVHRAASIYAALKIITQTYYKLQSAYTEPEPSKPELDYFGIAESVKTMQLLIRQHKMMRLRLRNTDNNRYFNTYSYSIDH